MNGKILGPVLGLCLFALGNQAQSACDQLSPNPNPTGHTSINVSSSGCNDGPYLNSGTVINSGRLEDRGEFQNDGVFTNSGTYIYRQFSNNGVVDNSGAFHPPSFGYTVHNNSGGVLINSGIISNSGGLHNEGTLINSGEMVGTGDFSNGGMLINSGRIFSAILFGNSGTLISTGSIEGGGYFGTTGTLVVEGQMFQTQINVTDGVVQGTGTIRSPTESGIPGGPGVLVNGGAINAGHYGVSTGTLTIDGKLSFLTGTLLTEIAGTDAGLFDTLRVTDAASFLAGTFTFSFLDKYRPDVGDEWTFLTAAKGITGWENLALAYTGIPANYLFSVSERNNSLVLSVAAVPEPEVYASMALGLAFLGFLSRRKRAALT